MRADTLLWRQGVLSPHQRHLYMPGGHGRLRRRRILRELWALRRDGLPGRPGDGRAGILLSGRLLQLRRRMLRGTGVLGHDAGGWRGNANSPARALRQHKRLRRLLGTVLHRVHQRRMREQRTDRRRGDSAPITDSHSRCTRFNPGRA